MDDKFVGSTPSTLRLKPGDHVITVSKAGFTIWERNITLSQGSSITVNAALEKKE